MNIVEQYLYKLKAEKRRWIKTVAVLTVLSITVAMWVLWDLRLTGIAGANGATCGIAEHQHDEQCSYQSTLVCGYNENEIITDEQGNQSAHVHTLKCFKVSYLCGYTNHIHDLSCYTDNSVDMETAADWEKSLPKLTGDRATDIVLIAQSQLGMGESERNYALAEDGVTKQGITRYGQWYGNPYGKWSNMFTSFCLRYAGVSEYLLNSGAEVLRLQWQNIGNYRVKGNYSPNTGDIVFLDKNRNGTVDATAIIVEYSEDILTVIEGDVDNKVAELTYDVNDGMVVGYGLTAPESNLLLLTASQLDEDVTIGATVSYSSSLIQNGNSFILYTVGTDGKYYAMDGNANAVEIKIDSKGNITCSIDDPSLLYWTFNSHTSYDNRPTYYIQNKATGRYLHPFTGDDGGHGVLLTDKWETALYQSGAMIKFRGARQNNYAWLENNTYFTNIGNLNSASGFYFGRAPQQVTLWLDGTHGGLMTCSGSDNTSYQVYSGVRAKLPTVWKSPTKYTYILNGWVNIKTGEYYLPGDEIIITENTVLYADWVAATYDIGTYNAYVTDTVSTNDFVTTKVFDYNSLINLLSSSVSMNVSSSSHSETWSHVASGNVTYKNQETLNFSFNDHDSGGMITNLNNLNAPNTYTGGGVYSGIYTDRLGEILFSTDNLFDPKTGTGVIGKHYLGEADHLFRFENDPSSPNYGYYYYDAKLNAAAYNQSDGRFYVYDFLERLSDSASTDGIGKYSDFVPLNSPYANTNGQSLPTYSYNGENGEYGGVQHYQYDSRYNTNGSTTSNVSANFWFGMSVEVSFYLPNVPGTTLADGSYGNKDIYGNDMVFKFSGDDDVWILVDGKVVLDIGGIHGEEAGDINFTTGVVRINGQQVATLSGIADGDHTLTIYYLERGSSQSNCAMYFNLAPRFTLTLQKEDVLTQEVLNGAQFTVYKDLACTIPCDLWVSRESYQRGDPAQNTFTIQNGKIEIWGFGTTNTYYIKETKPPDEADYICANGIICMTLDKNGVASYSVEIVPGTDSNGNSIPVSNGFTVHGFKINEETQEAFIVITNAQEWVEETTEIYVDKVWGDTKDHSYDTVIVYLQITDPDGTVRRIREVALSAANDWKYTWTNLPKYLRDGVTEVQYSVTEAYVQGYAPEIEELETGTVTKVTWAESYTSQNGGVYILKTANGYLSAVASNQNTLCFVDEATAKESSLALWTATVSGNYVVLRNQHGQALTYYNSGSTRYFYLTTGSSGNQNLMFDNVSGGLTLSYRQTWSTYYVCGLNSSKYALAQSSQSSAMLFLPMSKTSQTTTIDVDGTAYRITNVPLDEATSLTVTKKWSHPTGNSLIYEREQVTVRLLANGVDTGRTVTLNLKNNWKDSFWGLPYTDEEGNVIRYTVEEVWKSEDWRPIYGLIVEKSGTLPTYETTITNHYIWTGGNVELPETGGSGNLIYILCGIVLTMAPLVYGISLRCRHGRRERE